MAVLGAQQSTLESVLLKRKLMGPTWLTLACPTRVDPGAQVILPIEPQAMRVSCSQNALRLHTVVPCLPAP